MALLKWTVLDTITERSANNKSIRKGTEAEIAAIVTADNEKGDVTHNTTEGFLQIQTAGGATDKRGNMTCAPIQADEVEVTVVGTTPTKVKEFGYAKNSAGFKGNQLTIIAEIKTSNAGTTAHLRVRLDGSGSDSLDLTTTSATFEIKTGTIDITGKADGKRTVEIYLDDGTGDTASNKLLEVYGI